MRKAISGLISVVAFMLCVSIVAASVDPLPDPPAVKPERVDVKADCLGEPHAGVPSACEDASLANCCAVVRWFAWRHILEAERCDNRFLLVRHATDPSPPLAA
ncbi:MAG: hypothetical protein LAP38_09215 [Acidobacteriia bacterium]|nr:hypothetical protein [Terriglobia bacterium]